MALSYFVRGKDHCTASPHFEWIGFYQIMKSVVTFVCSKATQSEPVKLETSCLVIDIDTTPF